MTIDPINHFLFTTNSNYGVGDNTVNDVTTYRINTTSGKLTKVAISGKGILHVPAGIVADPSGKFVYVGDLKQEPSCAFDQCIGATSSFRVSPTTGKLTVVTGELPYPGDPVVAPSVFAVAR